MTEDAHGSLPSGVVLRAQEGIRAALAQARDAHPDLTGLLDLYEDLVAAQLEATAQMHTSLAVPDEMVMRQRLQSGRPQLGFDQLGIEPVALAHSVRSAIAILARHSAARAEAAAALPESAPGELLRQARGIFENPSLPQIDSPAAGLVTLAVRLALTPYLERAAEALLPHLEQGLWQRGYCLVCGAAPDLALLGVEDGARYLVCARCNSAWRYARLKCPFCATNDYAQAQYYPGDDATYRLYVCESCKHYLKTLDLRQARRTVFVPVERFVTVAMDLAAQERGYRANGILM